MAARKKDLFTKVNTNPVYNTIAEATAEQEQLPGQYAIVDTEGTIEQEEQTAPEKPKRKQKDRKTYNEAEAAEALESLKTSGRKGLKLQRINLAFTPANYDFVKIMAQVRGQSLTEFINAVIAEARENHAETYQKAIEFRNSL